MLWIKAFHVIAMVCWFAGIFYLPRLFVYHAQSEDPRTRETLQVMERKLYRFITPFAVLTVALGLALAARDWNYYFSALWFQLKLVLVVLLLGYHRYCGHLVSVFATGRNRRSHVFYRWFNELPVFILFGAVLLAVVKPF